MISTIYGLNKNNPTTMSNSPVEFLRKCNFTQFTRGFPQSFTYNVVFVYRLYLNVLRKMWYLGEITHLWIFHGWIHHDRTICRIISLQVDCKNFDLLLHNTTFNYRTTRRFSGHPPTYPTQGWSSPK